MKRLLRYGIAFGCAALLLPACTTDDTRAAGSEGAGTLEMRITGTRAEAGGYDPFDYLTVRIYNDKGLVRKYTSRETLPDELQLLAGEYRIAVEAGDRSTATFTNKTYTGEESFTVTAHQVQTVEVPCKTINVISEVAFDASIAENFGQDFAVDVCAGDAFDADAAADGSVPALTFTADGTGYFLLPDGVTNLSWRFRGTHCSRGEVETTGVFEDVKAGGKYTLTLRYSPDIPGYVDFTLTVDTDPDRHDDTIIFSPDPSIEGEGFDANQLQRYLSGTKTFLISSVGTLQSAVVVIGDRQYDLIAPAQAGIASSLTDPNNLTVTFEETFFAALPVGDNRMQFQISDDKGGALTRNITIRRQGIVGAQYDPWGCSFTVQGVIFDTELVKLACGTAEGEKQEVAVRPDGQDSYTLRLDPQWQARENENGLTVYAPTPGKGFYAGGITYEYTITADEAEISSGTFVTAAGDPIENAGMDDWSNYTVVGSLATGGVVPYPNASGHSFWVGGNNKQTNALCTANTTDEGRNGAACAQLQPTVVAGIFAAGNLFTGTFACGTGLLDMFGYASFGQPYTFTARPAGLKLRYKATVTQVTNPGGPLTKDDIDPGRIFVCITDWSSRHAVKSGKSYDENTFWDPVKKDRVNEGPILGYGNRMLTQSTDGWVEETLPIVWYDTQKAPSAGSYSLSISCVTSAYGDYVAGSTNNELLVEDFEWVY